MPEDHVCRKWRRLLLLIPVRLTLTTLVSRHSHQWQKQYTKRTVLGKTNWVLRLILGLCAELETRLAISFDGGTNYIDSCGTNRKVNVIYDATRHCPHVSLQAFTHKITSAPGPLVQICIHTVKVQPTLHQIDVVMNTIYMRKWTSSIPDMV
jgi:hypothetical protein